MVLIVLLARLALLLATVYIAVVAEQAKTDVIVVGAGAAGIAAASKLHSQGIGVIVLEAEGRIGGRIHSVLYGDSYVELGAEWCHGESGNMVYQLTDGFNILKHSDYQRKLYFSDGYEIDDEFNNQLIEIYDDIYDGDGDTDQPDDVTMGEYFIENYNETIHKLWSKDTKKLNIAKKCLSVFNHAVLADEGSFNWNNQSAESDYENSSGDLELNWDGKGYKTILETMMDESSLPQKDIIRLNKHVTNIIRTENEVVSFTQDGSTYIADHLITTVSVGVLKNNLYMFTPSLSARKIKAVQSMGFDGVHKIIAKFSNNWWKNLSQDLLVWTESKQGKFSWLNAIAAIYKVERNPHLLSIWFTGERVPDIENLPDSEILEGLDVLLQTFYGSIYNVTKAEEILREKWFSHPHFRGVYAFQTVADRQTLPHTNEILGEPISNHLGVPKVLFAGEATSPDHYGTVHGAIETGYREADRIISLYNETLK